MIEQISFYFSHSFNDLRVNKRLTFFALLSVAAGVAAIVSLQTLALMISMTLDTNLQSNNRGDVTVHVDIEDPDEIINAAVESGILNENIVNVFGDSNVSYKISESGVGVIEEWIAASPYAGQVDLTYRIATTGEAGVFTGTGIGVSVTNLDTGEQMSQLSPIVIDAEIYPFYSQVLTTDNQTLNVVMQQPDDIVVGDTLAEQLELQIGDTVSVNGSSATFTVRGIVNAEQEVKNLSSDFFTGIFGFYYLDFSAITLFEDKHDDVQTVYFKLAQSEQVQEFSDALEQAFPYFIITTTDDVRDNNDELTSRIDKFVALMGLISLLLGSIGIINTMQVVVRRRMLEIAVLKTLGLQSDQITFLFLTEALLIGVFGSVFGIVLGFASTFALKGVVENIFTTHMPFVLAPQPALNGFAVGVVVATVFGFLPTLAAGQVRPGIVLRPSQGVIPRAGVIRSVFALGLIIAVVSAIVNGIIDHTGLAIAGVTGAFMLAGLLYLLLMLLIWLMGRFIPVFGIVDLKVSLRQMLAAKRRGASTLLALVVGVFSLSTITLFAQSITNILDEALSGADGNVIVSAQMADQLPELEAIINRTEGVNGYTVSVAYAVELVSFSDAQTGESYDADGLRQLLRDSDLDYLPVDTPADEQEAMQQQFLSAFLLNISIEVRSQLQEAGVKFSSGRDITVDDTGKALLVMQENEIFEGIGVDAGDTITYAVRDMFSGAIVEEIAFEIVGIRSQSAGFTANNPYYAPSGAFPVGIMPSSTSIMVDVDEAYVHILRRDLSQIPGTFVIETSTITHLFTNLLDTFTAFPTMVAILGLIVGGVVIANSVALATMERRHEIAVMKAVGLQRERVLGMLLLENGILGFIGGMIGVGLGLIALTAFSATLKTPLSTIPFGLGFMLMLLCVFVALFAAIMVAWDASGEKPLHVLRHD